MLRQTNTHLKQTEMNILDEARALYKDAFTKRVSNPSDFYVNLASLKILAQACHQWMIVATPHLEKQAEAKNKAQTSWLNLFKNRANNEVLKQTNIINEAKHYMLDGLDEVMKEGFAKDPRITGLNYHEHHKTKFNSKNKIIGYDDNEEYKITFSDKSCIILNYLSDEAISKAKTEFTNKMEELALASENKMKVT